MKHGFNHQELAKTTPKYAALVSRLSPRELLTDDETGHCQLTFFLLKLLLQRCCKLSATTFEEQKWSLYSKSPPLNWVGI